MCGRYYVDDETSLAMKRIVSQIDQRLNPGKIKKGEIFPTNQAPVLINNSGTMQADLFSWGFPNFKSSGVIINARTETAFEKKTFRESLISMRCIIPANGFYEWNKSKDKIYFTHPKADIIYMAGIYNTFKNENRFVILTTNANQSIVDIHDRMPLILQNDQLLPWLTDNSQTQDLLKQVPTLLERKSDYEQTKLDLI